MYLASTFQVEHKRDDGSSQILNVVKRQTANTMCRLDEKGDKHLIVTRVSEQHKPSNVTVIAAVGNTH